MGGGPWREGGCCRELPGLAGEAAVPVTPGGCLIKKKKAEGHFQGASCQQPKFPVPVCIFGIEMHFFFETLVGSRKGGMFGQKV